MASLLINDSFTLDGKIAARGPWPALVFRYRPALKEAVDEYLAACRQEGELRRKGTAKFILAHLQGWDVTGAADNPPGAGGGMVPISEASVRQLPTPYVEELLNHLCGYSFSEQAADLKNS